MFLIGKREYCVGEREEHVLYHDAHSSPSDAGMESWRVRAI